MKTSLGKHGIRDGCASAPISSSLGETGSQRYPVVANLLP